MTARLPYVIQLDEVTLDRPLTSALGQGIRSNFNYLGDHVDDFSYPFELFGDMAALQNILGNAKEGDSLKYSLKKRIFGSKFYGVQVSPNNLMVEGSVYAGRDTSANAATISRNGIPGFRVAMKNAMASNTAPSIAGTIDSSLIGAGTSYQTKSRISSNHDVESFHYDRPQGLVGISLPASADLSGNKGDFKVFDLVISSTHTAIPVVEIDKDLNVVYASFEDFPHTDIFKKYNDDGSPKNASDLASLRGYVYDLVFASQTDLDNIYDSGFAGRQYLQTKEALNSQTVYRKVEVLAHTPSALKLTLTAAPTDRDSGATLFAATSTIVDGAKLIKGVHKISNPTGNDTIYTNGDFISGKNTGVYGQFAVSKSGTTTYFHLEKLYSWQGSTPSIFAEKACNFFRIAPGATIKNLANDTTYTHSNFKVGEYYGQNYFYEVVNFTDSGAVNFRKFRADLKAPLASGSDWGSSGTFIESFTSSTGIPCASVKASLTRPAELNGFIPDLVEIDILRYGSIGIDESLFKVRSYVDGGTVSFVMLGDFSSIMELWTGTNTLKGTIKSAYQKLVDFGAMDETLILNPTALSIPGSEQTRLLLMALENISIPWPGNRSSLRLGII